MSIAKMVSKRQAAYFPLLCSLGWYWAWTSVTPFLVCLTLFLIVLSWPLFPFVWAIASHSVAHFVFIRPSPAVSYCSWSPSLAWRCNPLYQPQPFTPWLSLQFPRVDASFAGPSGKVDGWSKISHGFRTNGIHCVSSQWLLVYVVKLPLPPALSKELFGLSSALLHRVLSERVGYCCNLHCVDDAIDAVHRFWWILHLCLVHLSNLAFPDGLRVIIFNRQNENAFILIGCLPTRASL